MNKSVTNSVDLDAAIAELKSRRQDDFLILKSQLNTSYKELQPSRIAKRIVEDLRSEPDVKGYVTETLISVVGGFISKRLLMGKSNSIVKSLVGFAVQLVTTKLIANKIK